MIVPEYWAEARVQGRVGKRQATVRRFGWSDQSLSAAQAMADARAAEALADLIAGKPVARRELKRSYNGSEGVPIREEVIERVGDMVITRNLYGALCLNTPNVLFADVDFEDVRASPSISVLSSLLILAAVAIGYWLFGWPGAGVAALAAALAVAVLVRLLRGLNLIHSAESQVQAHLHRFVATYPNWHLRLYRTPAGLRILAMHDTFSPDQAETEALFRACSVDSVYRQMCQRQRCFRARLSAKPWRIGMRERIGPRPGVWPVKDEHRSARERWVQRYSQRAEAYAACRYLSSLGDVRRIAPACQVVADLHDQRSRALSDLPLA